MTDTISSTTVRQVDNDVLYREGQTGQGEVTYTPRLVVMDLQGSLGLLPQVHTVTLSLCVTVALQLL